MVGSPFAYVRDAYSVPVFRGARVWWYGTPGRIVWADAHVAIRFAIADARENRLLRCYLRPSELRADESYPGERSGRRKPRETIKVYMHPCEDGIAYDRETPVRHRPSGWGSHVWSELCHAFGVNPYGTDEERRVAYHPALREPWPRDPRTELVAS